MSTEHKTFFKSKEILTSLLLFFAFASGYSQVSFERSASLLTDVRSEISMISADVNNDQQDDLVFFENGNQLSIQLNNGLGRDWKYVPGPVVSGNVWAGIVVDFNNDGLQEIVCGTAFTPIRIFTYDYKTESYILYLEFQSPFFVQNINGVDLNEDGLMDLFICNDKGENYVYINDGVGGFSKETPIDFSTTPASDQSGNYGSIFIDFDLDGDRDLYISKCSAFADDSDDPRRINQLFVNDGNGNFSDQAADLGLAIGAQTWVSNFADIDLDGDLDLLVANHYEDLNLFENVDGEYIDIKDESGLFLQNSFWQVSFHDFDNDGYQDLLIAADDVFYYHNNGDKTFTHVPFEIFPDFNRGFSCTVADYNNDGFLDFTLGYGGFQEVSEQPDSMFINQGNDNNWIMFSLEGTIHNSDAEGARIELYANGVKQMRQMILGHSYGIQDSKLLHFGLGNAEIDSAFIYWDGKNKESLGNLDVNNKYYVKEGECKEIIKGNQLISEEFCLGSTIEVGFNDNSFQSWQDDSSGDIYASTTEDVIYANYGNECDLEAWKIYPIYLDTTKIEEFVVLKDRMFNLCPLEPILLKSEGNNPIWNNNLAQDIYLSVDDSEIILESEFECAELMRTYIREDALTNFVAPDPIIKYSSGEDVSIDVVSENATWFIDDKLFYEGPTYTFENLTEDIELEIRNEFVQSYNSSVGLEEVNKEKASYPSNTLNIEILFEVRETMRLKSVEAATDITGVRKLVIYKENYEFVFEVEKMLSSDDNTVEIDFVLTPGKYILTTDQSVNFSNLGVKGPILYREAGGYIEYPYTDESGLFSIIQNGLQIYNSYYSFYNWKVESVSDKICDYERYDVLIQDVTAVDEIANKKIYFQNPVLDQLNIFSEVKTDYYLLDNTGKILMKGKLDKGENVLNVYEFDSGIYYLRLSNAEIFKLFIIR